MDLAMTLLKLVQDGFEVDFSSHLNGEALLVHMSKDGFNSRQMIPEQQIKQFRGSIVTYTLQEMERDILRLLR